MCEALELAKTIVGEWLSEHPDCFPPVVLHFTDGQSTDGDPSGVMNNLTSLSSSDGNVLLFKIHISGNPNARQVPVPRGIGTIP